MATWLGCAVLGLAAGGCTIEGTRQRGDECLQDRECVSPLRCEVNPDGRSLCVSPTRLDGGSPVGSGTAVDSGPAPTDTPDVPPTPDVSMGLDVRPAVDAPAVDVVVVDAGTMMPDGGVTDARADVADARADVADARADADRTDATDGGDDS